MKITVSNNCTNEEPCTIDFDELLSFLKELNPRFNEFHQCFKNLVDEINALEIN
jgi:hypothetical protein